MDRRRMVRHSGLTTESRWEIIYLHHMDVIAPFCRTHDTPAPRPTVVSSM
jgi:hypothetical protein